MLRYTVFIGAAFILSALRINAQALHDSNLIQFSGRLYDELLQPLPYAHLFLLNSDRGAITDDEGKFSLIVHPFDSVMFSSLGHHHKTIIIPDTIQTHFYIRDVLLATDTFLIDEVIVYRWKSYDEFKQAFLNLELPDDDMDRAMRNIAMLKAQIILESNPSASANYRQVMTNQFNQLSTEQTTPTYQIFNVFAWSKFFEALKNGDFSNKND